MRQYEFMAIFRPDFEVKDAKKRDAVLQKLLGSQATLKEVTDMGRKTLAYPIAKHTEGNYILAVIEADALKVGEIEKQMRLQTDVIRYLLTVKD